MSLLLSSDSINRRIGVGTDPNLLSFVIHWIVFFFFFYFHSFRAMLFLLILSCIVVKAFRCRLSFPHLSSSVLVGIHCALHGNQEEDLNSQ